MTRVALVLHSHIPYVRRNGTWPCGEDLYFQAALESYVPMLGALERLAARGLRGFLTVGITPILAEQMADARMRAGLVAYAGAYEPRAMQQVANVEGYGAAELRDLAAFHALFAREQLARLDALGGDVAAGFAALAHRGAIELLGGPATHPLLTHVAPDLAAWQLESGLRTHERIFGARPHGIWTPECAIDASVPPLLRSARVDYTIADAGSTDGAPAIDAGGVRLLAFDREVAMRVWSPDGGYPAGEWYRDFHAYDLEAGFKNWRVTDRSLGWLGKRFYEPDRAAKQARLDAEAFVAALGDARPDGAQGGDVVVAFDTELFGHWWFEGVAWLEHVLALLEAHPRLRPATLGEVAAESPAEAGEPRAGTWGVGGDFRSWRTPDTEDLWKRTATAEAETAELVARDASGPAATQLVREVFLLQSSDWTYMVGRDENAGYARERFDAHEARWAEIAAALGAGDEPAADAAASRWAEIDNAPAVALPRTRGA